MASYEFDDLKKVYEYFQSPVAIISVNGKELTSIKSQNYSVTDVEINLTCGFEAGMASFSVGGVYEQNFGQFDIDGIKKNFPMGSSVSISLGYGLTVREVFTGFISQLNFIYHEKDMPMVRVTAMDAKGLMMAGQYNNQLTAGNYSDAVKEIFERTSYKALQTQEIIGKISVTNTPDKKETSGTEQQVTSLTMEMVGESDYEFVVRAAKKFNYEFFCLGDEVIFRKAFGEALPLCVINNSWMIKDYDVETNITGLVQNIEVRGVDVGKAQVITANRKVSNKISLASKAKGLIAGSSMVVRDPTVNSKEDAENRLNFLEYDVYNRLSCLDTQFIGIPEIIPGRFVWIEGLTHELAYEYYIKSVTHTMRTGEGFLTRIEAVAPSLDPWNKFSTGVSGASSLI